MNAGSIRSAAYYVVAIIFHLTLFFTDVGNYLHGGSVGGLVALQSGAVVIAVMAMKIFLKAGSVARIFIVLCVLIPLLFLIASIGYGVEGLISMRTWGAISEGA